MSKPRVRMPGFGIRLALALSIAAAALPGRAAAQIGPVVRDAEIEAHLLAWSVPIFGAAGLDAEAVRTYLVGSSQINAFVTGGQNIFLNTGTIVRARNADALMGVVAHEVGHIAGGHLVRMREAAENAPAAGLLAGTLIALGATALGGGAIDAAAGAISLAGTVSERAFLQYTRANEHAADTAALRYLEAVGRPVEPLIGLLEELLAKEELTENLDPYRRSHPLTADRIQQIRDRVDRSGAESPLPDPVEQAAYDRIVAKIIAFTETHATADRIYGEGRTTAARYARAIALYRKPDLRAALAEIDGLIEDYPEDPYFRELRGQMLLENGEVGRAAENYREAARLAPDTPLILIGLAMAELGTNDPSLLEGTIANLERALAIEKDNANAWRLLAQARGRAGRTPLADLAHAEYSLLLRRAPDALRFATRALRGLPGGSPAAQRAKDIARLLGRDVDGS